MSSFDTLDDLPDAQRVLLRLDLNSPVEDGDVQDNRRFERHAVTVSELVDAGHRVVCMAHQGRPGRDTFISLKQHAEILADHVGHEVKFTAETFGQDALSSIRELESNEILLLENTRMCDEELPEEKPETKADTDFVQTLAPEVDAYINDAYSSAHRSHASLVGFPNLLPAYAGRVMETEYEANTAIAARDFDGRVTMAVGGIKATDVIDVMTHLGDTVDNFLIGGVVGQLFLRARGYPVGFDTDPEADLYDSQWEENHTLIEEILAKRGDQVTLPTDLAFAGDDGERVEVDVDDIDKSNTDYLDIGTDTSEMYADTIRGSEAVFTKGALGVFENKKFSTGTVTALEAIAETDCFSVVGGGDTSRAIGMYGMDENDFGHVSIAGGAYIRALTGADLIGVEMLEGKTN